MTMMRTIIIRLLGSYNPFLGGITSYILKMKHLSFLVTTIILCFSCSKNYESENYYPVFDIQDSQDVPVSEVFDSLEIIPMRTDCDEAYTGPVGHLVACEDYFIFKGGKRSDIFVFDKDGYFVSSSKKVYGHGNGEIFFMLGGGYNPYSKLIEVLTTTSMKFYDVNFNFVKSVPIPTQSPKDASQVGVNPGTYFDFIYDLSSHEHILNSYYSDRANAFELTFFNSEEESITRTLNYGDLVIKPGTSQQTCFMKDNGNMYAFVPDYTDKVYGLDVATNRMMPLARLSFGDRELTRGIMSAYEGMDREISVKRSAFIKKSSFHIPYKFAVCQDNLLAFIFVPKDKQEWYFVSLNLKDGISKRFKFSNDNYGKYIPEFNTDGKYVYYICNSKEEVMSNIQSFGQTGVSIHANADTTEMNNVIVLKYKLK